MTMTTISPNMNLPIPIVSQDPGPDWANNVNASLNIIDSHNHSNGEGVPITPSGININADLPMNGNNLITPRSVRFLPQTSNLSGPLDIGCLYESGVDLYYNDGNGNQVRITQSGSVTGSTGTITGLPSGTASASYSTGTFTWQSATNTPASMNMGPIILGAQVANPKTITIQVSSSTPSNYALTLPLAAPQANQVMVSDGSGNFTWISGFAASGSFTGTFTGVSGSVTATFYYSIAGNGVTITATETAFTKVGNGLAGITGVPSILLPSSSTIFSTCVLSVNGGVSFGSAAISATSSGLNIYNDLGQDAIANGASCILLQNSFSYVVRP